MCTHVTTTNSSSSRAQLSELRAVTTTTRLQIDDFDSTHVRSCACGPHAPHGPHAHPPPPAQHSHITHGHGGPEGSIIVRLHPLHTRHTHACSQCSLPINLAAIVHAAPLVKLAKRTKNAFVLKPLACEKGSKLSHRHPKHAALIWSFVSSSYPAMPLNLWHCPFLQ